MELVELRLPLYFDRIEDIYDDNIDVFVELDDGMTYTMVVTTPKFYYSYMDKEGLNYIPPYPPDIIVRSLTEDNIRSAVETYIKDNAYWLKVYYLAMEVDGAFDIQLMNRKIEEVNKVSDVIERGSITKITKLNLPNYFNRIEDIYDNNIDISVELNDGMTYTLFVATPKYYYSYMDKKGLGYIPAAPPKIIVRSLTEDNIRGAVEKYIEGDEYIEDNAYWLKLYFLAGVVGDAFDIQLMNRRIEELKKDNDEMMREYSKDYEGENL